MQSRVTKGQLATRKRMEKKRRTKVKKMRRRGKLKENKFDFLSAFQAEIIRLAEEKTGQKLTGGPIVSPLPRSLPPEKPRTKKPAKTQKQPSKPSKPTMEKKVTIEKPQKTLKTGLSWADLADSSDEDD